MPFVNMIYNLPILFFIGTLFGWILWKKKTFSMVQMAIMLLTASIIFLLALFLSIYLQPYQEIFPLFLLSSSIEESSRALIFFLMTPYLRKYFTKPVKQLELALSAGFIFALLENLGYIWSLPVLFFLIRAIIIFPLHIFLSMLHIHYKRSGFLIAWIIHTLYNFISQSTFIPVIILQGLTPLLWIFILFWLRKQKEKPFSAF